ncbi:MAG TPA: hypothetical protein VFM46_01905, partial [Pseudomonadales bacterium]|nr:hypothetical protein [Pseudomonadales bacterium]
PIILLANFIRLDIVHLTTTLKGPFQLGYALQGATHTSCARIKVCWHHANNVRSAEPETAFIRFSKLI